MHDIKNKWPIFLKSSERINLFIRNVSGRMDIYPYGSQLIPIFINKGSKSWMASFSTYNLLLKKALRKKTIKRLKSPIKPLKAIKMRFNLLLRFLPGKLANIDNCLFFNHSMMSTTLWPDIQNMTSIIPELIRKYPEYPIIFRSLNFVHHEKLLKNLIENKCGLMRVRQVALFNPKKKLTKNQRRHLNGDKKLLNSGGYEIIKATSLDTEEVSRVYKLYTNIYIEKYSDTNPQYTELFFSSILNDDRYGMFLLKKDNKIDAFALFELKNNIIQCPCLGYDTSLPSELGLYRQIGAVLDNYCIENNFLSNESSGVYKFKQRRGCELTPEYYAIYYKHLNLVKRFFWTVYIYLANLMPKVS